MFVSALWISGIHDTYNGLYSLKLKHSNGVQYLLTETAQPDHTVDTVKASRQHMSPPSLNDKVVHGEPQNQQLVNNSRHDQHLLSTLPQNVISGVKKFVFFIGYPRSGHSIIGSLLDAHPNVVIAHEYNVFGKLPRLIARHSARGQTNFAEAVKFQLFNELYQNSYINVFFEGRRSRNNKGYNLTLDDTWQGRYSDHILVIGDKNGDRSAGLYAESAAEFQRIYDKLLRTIQIPVVVIHCVRNPFDIISTHSLFRREFIEHHGSIQTFAKAKLNTTVKFRNNTLLSEYTNFTFKLADSVLNMTNSVFNKGMVVEVHNHELVSDPERTIHKLCQSLGIVCSQNFVSSCGGKVFPKVSRTRFAVDWPEDMKLMVENRLEKYPFFKRYSFNSSI